MFLQVLLIFLPLSDFASTNFFFYPLSLFIFSHSEYIPPINVTRLSWLFYLYVFQAFWNNVWLERTGYTP